MIFKYFFKKLPILLAFILSLSAFAFDAKVKDNFMLPLPDSSISLEKVKELAKARSLLTDDEALCHCALLCWCW